MLLSVLLHEQSIQWTSALSSKIYYSLDSEEWFCCPWVHCRKKGLALLTITSRNFSRTISSNKPGEAEVAGMFLSLANLSYVRINTETWSLLKCLEWLLSLEINIASKTLVSLTTRLIDLISLVRFFLWESPS